MEDYRFKTRRDLKQQVKDLYRGQWGQAILLNLVPIILVIIGRMAIITSIFSTFSFLSYMDQRGRIGFDNGSRGFNLIWFFVVSLITLGIMYTTINWLRTNRAPQNAIKDTFTVFTGRYFIGALVIEILIYIFSFFWSLLLVIPGIIKSYAYSQAPYIFKDLADTQPRGDVSYLDCITQSRRLMNGHKFRFFMLQLSFLGWDILDWLSFGIGSIWLTPYKNGTYAAFYNDLVAQSANDFESELY